MFQQRYNHTEIHSKSEVFCIQLCRKTMCMTSVFSSLNTYCGRSAFQLTVTCTNHFALLAADSNCGVLTEAEACHCQQCASCEKRYK